MFLKSSTIYPLHVQQGIMEVQHSQRCLRVCMCSTRFFPKTEEHFFRAHVCVTEDHTGKQNDGWTGDKGAGSVFPPLHEWRQNTPTIERRRLTASSCFVKFLNVSNVELKEMLVLTELNNEIKKVQLSLSDVKWGACFKTGKLRLVDLHSTAGNGHW